MRQHHNAVLAAGSAVALICTAVAKPEPVSAASADNVVDARINAIKQKIESLRQEQNQNWLNPADKEELRALVEEIITDAQSRTSLLAGGASAGYDNGFYFASDDGAFNLRMRIQAQFRAVWNNRDDSGSDDSAFGFENPRTKIIFKGDLFDDDFSFNVSGDFGSNGDFLLENAFVKHKFENGWSIWWGQQKLPFLREEHIPSRFTQGVDRSYVNELTTLGRSQGVMVKYSNSTFHAAASFNQGAHIRSQYTNLEFRNTPFDDGTEYAGTARAEAILAGDGGFTQFRDFSSWSDDQFAWLVGGAIHFQADEFGEGTSFKNKYFAWTADTQLEFGGANLFGSIVGLHVDSGDPAVDNFDQIGFVVQGGVFIDPDKIELFGRAEYYDFDGAVTGVGGGGGRNPYDQEISLYTAGVNVFFAGHARKWTTDFVWAADQIPAAANGLGILKDALGQDGQFVVRSQYQINF